MPIRVTTEEVAVFHAGGAGNVRVTAEEVAVFHSGGTSKIRVTEQMVAVFVSVTAAQDPIFRIPGFIGL